MEPTNPTPLPEAGPTANKTRRPLLQHLPQGKDRLYTYRVNPEVSPESTRGEVKVYHLFDDAEIQREVERYRAWKEEQAELFRLKKEMEEGQADEKQEDGDRGRKEEERAEEGRGEAEVGVVSMGPEQENEIHPQSATKKAEGASLSSPYLDDVSTLISATRPSSAKGTLPGMMKMLFLGGLALALGLVFSWLFLRFFLQSPIQAPSLPSAQLEQGDRMSDSQAAGSSSALTALAPAPQDDAVPTSAQPVTVLEIPPLTLQMIQAGAFAEEVNAEPIMAQLLEKGFEGVLTTGTPHRLFIGLAVDHDQGLQLGRYLQQQGVELYIKEYSIAGIERLSTAEQEDLSLLLEMLQQGKQLVSELARFSIASILAPEGRSGGEGAEEVAALFTAYLEAHRGVQAMLAPPFASVMEEMERAMTAAYLSYEHYMKSGEQQALWVVQQELIQFALAYERWIKTLHQVAQQELGSF